MSHGKACGGYAGAGASRFGRRRDDGSVGYKVLLACVGAYLRVKDESLRAVSICTNRPGWCGATGRYGRGTSGATQRDFLSG